MADGQVLIDSKLNTAGVERGTRDLKEEFQDLAKVTSKVAEKMEKELNGAGDAAEDASGSFKELFKANLSADLVVDALKEIGEAAIDLGKQAIEAAADINASNAQFEQTFKGVEAVARESLNKVAQYAGVTATRMQDSYTKIFAFSKSVGADQEAALNISARAMEAAADSAAYYDRSLEETTETLMSFIKGNYENDAALGIAATETTRNAKANELYAKSFQELSEAQKVDVLLAMVEAGNEASGALGQAAREADSWTNVLGELNEAWRLLLGVMGDPLLENLIPIIQGITGAMQSLVDTSASANLTAGMEGFRETMSGLDADFETTSQAIEKNAIMAELYKDRLAELEQAGLDTAESEREYANAVAALNSIYPDLNLQIDKQTGLLNKESKAQLASLDAMKKKAVYAAQEKKLTAALEAQADAILEVQAAQKALQAVQTESAALEQQLMELTGKSAQELSYLYGNRSLAIHELTSEQLALMDQIVPLIQEEKRLQQGIEEGNASIAAQDAEMAELKAECDATAASLGIVTEAEQETTAATDEAAKAQEELAKRFQDAKDSAMESLNSQIGLFQELELQRDTTADKIVENWGKQQEAFTNYAQNLQAAIDMGLDEALVQQLADGSQESMVYLQELVTGTGTSVTEINEQFRNLSKAKEVAASAMAGIQESITVELQGVNEAINQTLTDAGSGAAAAMETAAGSIQVSFTQPVQQEMETLGGVIEETFSNAADTLQESWGDKGQWFESNVESPIKTSMESMGTEMLKTLAEMESETDVAWSKMEKTMSSKLSNMESDNEAAWNRMVQDVEAAINRMQNKINSLKGKTVNVTVNKTGSGADLVSYSGYDGKAYSPEEASYEPAAAYAAPIGIPMLATGAVIPPNAPFFAILGDQTNGRNIEAPEQLIRNIIQGEIGQIVVKNEVSFAGELAPLARILYPEIRSEAQRIGKSLAQEVIM